MLSYQGKVFCFGDNINTDYIISSRRKRDTIDPEALKEFIMEDIRAGFFSELDGTSFIVAGSNFGCGSAMEVAAQILAVNNIPVVLARSFARSFFRNCVNNGIIPLETDTGWIREGDILHIIMQESGSVLHNLSKEISVTLPPFDSTVQAILTAGGIVSYMRLREVRGDNR